MYKLILVINLKILIGETSYLGLRSVLAKSQGQNLLNLIYIFKQDYDGVHFLLCTHVASCKSTMELITKSLFHVLQFLKV